MDQQGIEESFDSGLNNSILDHDSSFIRGPLPSKLTVVAIGGAGKQLVCQLCRKRHFFQYYIQNHMSLNIIVMDSDKSEREADNIWLKEIRDSIDARGGQGFIEVHYIYLPALASLSSYTSLTDPEIVKAIKTGPFEKRLKIWWLQDKDTQHEPPEWEITYNDIKRMDQNVSEDFSGGVHRRRAISKAIFYRLVSSGSDLQKLTEGTHFALVVGLGGGTGSGMFLDVARYIRERSASSQIWLYGILPSNREYETEKLNAAIALTELEYSNLQDTILEESPFNLIALTKLPDKYSSAGKGTDNLLEFDNAFSYIFLNLLYGFSGDLVPLFDARKRYNSFIFANAHIIRYPIEQLMDTSRKFKNVQTGFKEITAKRIALIKSVSVFLNDNALTTPGGISSGDISRYLQNELSNISSMWSDQFVKVFGYQTLKTLRQYQNNIPAPVETAKFEEIVSYIQKMEEFSSPSEFSSSGLDKGSGVDQELDKDIRGSLKSLEDIASLFPLISGIQQKVIRDVIIDYLCVGVDSPNIEKLKLELTKNDNDIARIITESDDKLKQLRNDQQNLNTEKKDQATLKHDISQSVQNMVTVFNTPSHEIPNILDKQRSKESFREKGKLFADEFNKVFADLSRREITALITEKNQDASLSLWKQKYGITGLINQVDEFSKDKRENLDGLATLVDKIGEYYFFNCAEDWCARAGFVERLKNGGALVDTRRVYFHRQKQAINNYLDENCKKWGIIYTSVEGPKLVDFRINKEFLTHKVEYDIEEYVDSIVKKINTCPVNLSGDQSYQDRINILIKGMPGNIRLSRPEWNLSHEDKKSLQDLLESSDPDRIPADLGKKIVDIYLKKLGILQKIESISKKDGDLATEIEDITIKKTADVNSLEKEKKIFQSTMELLDEIRATVKNQQTLIKKYQDEIQNLKEGISSREGELFDRGDYLTIFNKVNQNLLADIRKSNNSRMSALDNEKGEPELRKLYDEIKRTSQAQNSLMSTSRLGLEQNPIENQGSKSVVDRAALVISSPSAKLREMIGNNKFGELEELISDKAHLNYPRDGIISQNDLADPWDIGVTYFIGTSFLDNIKCFRDAFTLYQAKAERLFLHHTALMEKGEYIIRNKLLNLPDKAGDLSNREKSITSFEEEKALKEEILSLYKRNNLIEILKKYR